MGELAKDKEIINPKNTIFDIKRIIGRKFTDSKVHIYSKYFPFKVYATQDDNPVIEVMMNQTF